jgi:hypothetical protein
MSWQLHYHAKYKLPYRTPTFLLARIFALLPKNNIMAKTKTTAPEAAVDKKTHMGYNEKNPTQPQGSFKADSMETKAPTEKKTKKFPTTKKNVIK